MSKILVNKGVLVQALEALTPFVRGNWTPGLAVQAAAAMDHLEAALAEPVQEPVAKVELMNAGGNAGLATRIVEIDDHLRERLRPGQLLYPTPPQRKPLTEEEIRDLLEAEFLGRDGKRSWDDDLQVFRLAERAHRIGE